MLREASWHWDRFAEFCKYEIASGGPDPEMNIVGYMSRDCSLEERLWRAGCYVAVYNTPSAELLWTYWPWPRILQERELLVPWLAANWDRLIICRERRAACTIPKLTKCLTSYADWARNFAFPIGSPTENFLSLWEEVQKNVDYFGRYATLKVLDCFGRFCEVKMEAPDIRPDGGWSPVRSLITFLMPDRAEGVSESDADSINRLVSDAQEILSSKYGLKIDVGSLQILLCEYRESYEGQRQYPGSSHDFELGFYRRVWHDREDEDRSSFLQARKDVIPNEHLGDIHGWLDKRQDLMRVLFQHGYTWSDLLYDYNATSDLSSPVRRESSVLIEEKPLEQRSRPLASVSEGGKNMIIQIRGTSGSGKSELVRRVMKELNAQPIYNEVEKIEGYLLDGNIRVVGRYETACGGCDTIRDKEEAERLVRKYADMGHVIFEGLLLSGVWSRWYGVAQDYPGQYIWLSMDTPLETCHARVLQRNGGKPINMGHLESKYRAVQRMYTRAVEAGERAIWIDHTQAEQQLLGILHQTEALPEKEVSMIAALRPSAPEPIKPERPLVSTQGYQVLSLF